jgi:acid phosphatase type 7
MSSIGRRFAPVLALLAGVVPSCGPVEDPIRPDVAVAAADGCTISGTARDDVLRGTSGGDTLCGLGGHDVLIGGGGGDTLIGGAGSDGLYGGAGADSLDGGGDIDLLDGGPRRDVLDGGAGGDRCESNQHDRATSCWGAGPSPVIAAAGDIVCTPGASPSETTCQHGATSNLLVRRDPWLVLTLGDNQYEDGALEDFQRAYSASWGHVKAITRPTAGNHDYHVADARDYFSYFGAPAGRRGKGYYSFEVGDWHVIALNSNCEEVGGCEKGSRQEKWLRRDLDAHASTCTLAYWHHPRFSSALHGNNALMAAFWRALYDAGADIVLNGHDHTYERFAPQDPRQRADSDGIRQFVVGSGGRSHYGFGSPEPNSEVRNSNTFGVLELTLRADGYDWRFVPAAGGTFEDSGSDTCSG